MGCSACTNLTYCPSCLSRFFLTTDNKCVTVCPDRFFANPANQNCDSCLYDCLTCNNSQNCLSCSSNIDYRQLDSKSQRCVPISGYFENQTTIAEKCATGCALCSSFQACSKCVLNFYLTPSKVCNVSCPLRFFPNNITSTC